jgi:hypothetical protein
VWLSLAGAGLGSRGARTLAQGLAANGRLASLDLGAGGSKVCGSLGSQAVIVLSMGVEVQGFIRLNATKGRPGPSLGQSGRDHL